MDISVNKHPLPLTTPTPLGSQSAAEVSKGLSRPDLIITEAQPNPLSRLDAAEPVPDSALQRDDPLGKLLSTAFNLPPPPMPAFPS